MQIASLTLLLTGPVSWSITCGFSKSRECWLKMACSAAADMSKRPFLTYDACSLARLSAVRPVSPIYTFSHVQSLHFRRYTTPAWSFRFERSLMACWRDHFHGAGLPTTRAETSFWHKPAGAVRSCCKNKSHRMQNTSTSRSTDFRRQKTITSKTQLTLYGRGFCASDRTPTTTGSPAGPQSNQNVWVLPPISRNEARSPHFRRAGETFPQTTKSDITSAESLCTSTPRQPHRCMPNSSTE